MILRLGKSFAVLLAIAVLLAVSGCKSLMRSDDTYRKTSAQRAGTDESEEGFREGVRLQNSGRYDEAVEAFTKAYTDDPDGSFADDALHRAALIRMQQRDFLDSEGKFALLVERYPKSPHVRDSLFKLGLVRFENQRFAASIEAMKAYLASGQVPAMKSKAESHIGRCYAISGAYGEALSWYQKGYITSKSNAGKELILTEVNPVLDRYKDSQSLLALMQSMDPGPIHDRVRLRLAEMYIAEGKRNLANNIYQGIRKGGSDIKARQIAARKLTGLGRMPEGEGQAIGVLLPLSGKYRVFGEQALAGILLGIDFFGSGPGKAPVRVIVEDTQGSGVIAAEAVENLAANPDVMCIIGPLLSSTADAASQAANEAGIPILLMTRKEQITGGKPYAYRNFLTSTQQVKALLDYSNITYGARRFAVLYPENNRGGDWRDRFIEVAAKQGFEVPVVVGYEAGSTDYRQPIKQLKLQAKMAGGMDAIFIPDFHESIQMLAPQMLYYEVENIPLLGTSQWYSKSLAETTSGYLKTAVVAVAFFEDSDNPAVMDFVGDYRAHADDEPTMLAAFGFDNARIARLLIQGKQVNTREGFRQSLYEVQGHAGVCGVTTFLNDGDVDKKLVLLRLRRGRFVEVK